MESATFIAFVFAILSPFIWGTMNVLDKYIVSHKIKHILGFAFIAGMVNLFYGMVLALFLDWNGIGWKEMVIPGIVGFVMGLMFFFYYFMIQKDDVSTVVGFIYLYPLVVALLSFVFLHEVLSFLSYVGILLVMSGLLLLVFRRTKRLSGLWIIIGFAVMIGVNEFLIKVSTSSLPTWHAVAVNTIVMGLTVFCSFPFVRKGIVSELRNLGWAFLNESLTFLGITALYIAMAQLSATIVSSVSATQPLAVLLIELLATSLGWKITSEGSVVKKLVPLSLIVVGVILLSLTVLS